MNIAGQVAAAPISWGVCEVPGWGHQMWVDRVLAEMRTLGLRATELGPDGFLPATRARDLLREHGLSVVAGFVPAVLHDPSRLDRELHAIGPTRERSPTSAGRSSSWPRRAVGPATSPRIGWTRRGGGRSRTASRGPPTWPRASACGSPCIRIAAP